MPTSKSATREISRNLQEAAKGTQEVSTNIAGVNQAAGETGSAAEQLLQASGGLVKQGEELRVEVEKFPENLGVASWSDLP